MNKEQINLIIAKYRKLSASIESRNEEKAYQYERFADFIKENLEQYEDDSYETEEDLLDDFNEAEAEEDVQWNAMFPDGDEDDSITDYLMRN